MSDRRSALYRGMVVHRRLRPVEHQLRYALPMLLLDLDELPSLARDLRLFSHNRFNLFSFDDGDHLSGAGGGLRRQIEDHLARAGISASGAIRVLCMPRVLGFAFNPLSVFFCHAADGSIAAMLYEVNNTFGQRHSYLLPAAPQADGSHRHHCAKHFHVSPFLAMDMHYHFHLTPPGEGAFLGVEARQGDLPVLSAWFSGTRRVLTDRNLCRLFLRFPLLALQVLASIHWEALKLWGKGLRPLRRPEPPAEPVSFTPSRRMP